MKKYIETDQKTNVEFDRKANVIQGRDRHEINEKTNQNRIMCPQHASHLNIACFEERRLRFVHPRRVGHRWLQLQLLARKEHRALPPAGIAHVVVVDLHAVVREVVVQDEVPS